MRRVSVLAPVALLTSACTFRPWTPSASLSAWSEAVPTTTPTTLPAQAEVMARWQLPPGNPWAPFAKYTLLSSLDASPQEVELPDVESLEVVSQAIRAGERLASVAVPASTLWLVDLRGCASVALGATWSRRSAEPMAVVLTFNNWPAEAELIPAEETLSALVRTSPRLPTSAEGSRPVFLLDSWRLAYRFEIPDDDVTDNRYVVSDLPSVDVLRAEGITRIVYLVEDLDDTEGEEDDLHPWLLAYQHAGLQVTMVDLAWVLGIHDRSLEEDLASATLRVKDRKTLLDDPAFYARARGGFGGIHGGPSPMRSRVWRNGSGYYGGGGFSFGGGGG